MGSLCGKVGIRCLYVARTPGHFFHIFNCACILRPNILIYKAQIQEM